MLNCFLNNIDRPYNDAELILFVRFQLQLNIAYKQLHLTYVKLNDTFGTIAFCFCTEPYREEQKYIEYVHLIEEDIELAKPEIMREVALLKRNFPNIRVTLDLKEKRL